MNSTQLTRQVELEAREISKEILYKEVPEPVLGEHKEWIELYYKAWEIASKDIFHKEGLDSPRYMR